MPYKRRYCLITAWHDNDSNSQELNTDFLELLYYGILQQYNI